jgi:hypothetical protein
MEAFRDTLLACQLSDLGFRGSKFTWSNKRGSEDFVQERLDRALATEGWCEQFPAVEVNVLETRRSDHKPLWIRILPHQGSRGRPYSFKFEACWNLDPECASIVKSVWEGIEEGGAQAAAEQKLNKCRSTLSSWSSQKFGNVGRKIRTLSKKLEQLQRCEDSDNQENIKAVQMEIRAAAGHGRHQVEAESKASMAATWG